MAQNFRNAEGQNFRNLQDSEQSCCVCTDLKFLCYDSFTGQGQLLWVGICLMDNFGWRFSLVSMVSINPGIWFYWVEKRDAGETIEREESH
jgi:hypothetical protein